MNAGTERVMPELPCPRCGELTPSDSRYCSTCGAEVHAVCPDCGTPRGAVDVFCRKCGFNFRRKKLQLKTPAADARSEASERAESGSGLSPSAPLPQAQFRKSKKPFGYHMGPVMGTVRAVVMLAFLLLIAGAVFWGVYWTWENMPWKGLLEKIKQGPSAVLKPTAAPEQAVEPDWNARVQYWVGYYQDAFTPPPTNTRVEVRTVTGIREKGILLQVAQDHVLLKKKENQELGFPRVLLDRETRRIFFAEDYAAANAKAKVEAEKTEWAKQAGPVLSSRTSAVASVSSAAGVSSEGPPPGRTFVEIKCPACGGDGFFLVSEDLLKSNKGKQPCPVCEGRGYRRFNTAPEFPWPNGAARCTQCQGMGNVLARRDPGLKTGVIRASPCPRCHHRGYIVTPGEAAHNVPPRYD